MPRRTPPEAITQYNWTNCKDLEAIDDLLQMEELRWIGCSADVVQTQKKMTCASCAKEL
ncbi:hypothetical protein L208DRAFT_1415525 [Tricholoma matsutake]|nr:hypothetical protein L208DRAFT_1415525 [Tricholoma matsutake 945]